MLRILLALALAVGLVSAWGEARQSWGVDFFQFRAVGMTIWAAISAITTRWRGTIVTGNALAHRVVGCLTGWRAAAARPAGGVGEAPGGASGPGSPVLTPSR